MNVDCCSLALPSRVKVALTATSLVPISAESVCRITVLWTIDLWRSPGSDSDRCDNRHEGDLRPGDSLLRPIVSCRPPMIQSVNLTAATEPPQDPRCPGLRISYRLLGAVE